MGDTLSCGLGVAVLVVSVVTQRGMYEVKTNLPSADVEPQNLTYVGQRKSLLVFLGS